MSYTTGNSLTLLNRLHSFPVSGADLTGYLNEAQYYIALGVMTGQITNPFSGYNILTPDIINRFNKEYIAKTYSILGTVITGNPLTGAL
jgi:hypothetical protein